MRIFDNCCDKKSKLSVSSDLTEERRSYGVIKERKDYQSLELSNSEITRNSTSFKMTGFNGRSKTEPSSSCCKIL